MSRQSPSRTLFVCVFGPNDSTSFLKRGSHNDEAGENCGQADQRVNDGSVATGGADCVDAGARALPRRSLNHMMTT